MSQSVRICSRAELPAPGQLREANAADKVLCVANVDGVIRVIDNDCPHRGGPLSEGMLEAGKVVCPWHAWAFDPVTGATDSSQERVAVYPVTIAGEEVSVQLLRDRARLFGC